MNLQEMANLAAKFQQAGRFAEAEAVYLQINAACADNTGVLLNLALVSNQQQKFEQAITFCQRALAVRPNLIEAMNLYGRALYGMGKLETAIEILKRAVKGRPSFGEAQINLGNCYFQREQYEQAKAAYRRAAEADARDVRAQINLSAAAAKLDQWEEAEKAARAAVEIQSDHATARNSLGFSLYGQGKYGEAISSIRQAIALDPAFALAHWNFGSIQLLHGNYAQGWGEYAWRWQVPEIAVQSPLAGVPMWEGESLEGRRLLLFVEQGLGDVMQFIRYAPMLAARGAKVLLSCQKPLVRLLSRVEGIAEVVAAERPAPAAEVQCSVAELPRLLETTVETIPRPVGYLSADEPMSDVWASRLAARGPSLKVGVVWAGRPEHLNDRRRSMPLSVLGPLGQISGVSYFSLQKGAAAAQLRNSPLVMTDWTNELEDFADTAALVANLDLVMAVDTSVAHLAGGMGKPTWVLLPVVPDWRWMLDREDSPWYPSVRLFRQKQCGDWSTVISAVGSALRTLVA